MATEDDVFDTRRGDEDEEDSMHNVRDLISRYRGEASPSTKRKTRSDSSGDELENMKSARKDSSNQSGHPMSGKFVLRSARQEDPLHFIHRIIQSKASEDESDTYDAETEELLTIIRGTPANEDDDLDTKRQSHLRSLLTSALIKQFEPSPGSSSTDQSEASNIGQGQGQVEGQSGVTVSQPLGLAPLCQSEEDLINSEDSLDNTPDDDLDPFTANSHLSNDLEPITATYDPGTDLDPFSARSHDVYQSGSSRRDLDPIVCQGQINSVHDLELVPDDLDLGTEHENKFEKPAAEVKGQGHDEVDGGQQQMSIKEAINGKEEEKDVDEEGGDDGEEVLETVADNLDQHKGDGDGTPKRGDVSSADLDFACVQSTSQLNVDVGKQKALLRQRGTLAARRKPTRSSLRSDMAEQVASEASGVMISPDEDDDDDEETHRASTSAPPADMEGIRAPVLLPGLGEIANKPKLRPTRPPKPSVGDSPTSSSGSPAPPPWLLEAKQKRASRQPRGEAEKLSKESEPEKPAWMKDALAKRQKRASVTSTQSQQSDTPSSPPLSTPTATSDPSSDPTPVPWLQERPLRKNRLQPLPTNTPLVADNETKSSASPAAVNTIIINKNTEPSMEARNNREQDENQPPIHRSHMLPPIRSTPTSSSRHSSTNDEATDTSPSTPMWRAEISQRKKSKSYIQPHRVDQPMKLGETPAWKKELAEKRKSRRGSSIDSTAALEGGSSSHSTAGGGSSIAGGGTAAADTAENGVSGAATMMAAASEPALESLPPWKQELEMRKKRGSLGGNRDSVTSPPPSSTTAAADDDVPEWIKAVEKRRSRLASAGYKT